MSTQRRTISLTLFKRPEVAAYAQVLKPRETGLLAFAGLAAGILASAGHPPLLRLLTAVIAVTAGSAGCNGLTNYLDRDMDARMVRTRGRPIPSGRIQPPERVLPVAIGLVEIGLAIAFALNIWAGVTGLAGVITAVVARKRSITHVPLGLVSSCAPLLVGWLCINQRVEPTLIWLCALIAVWTPIHVWSLMSAYRDDYLQAGVRLFPLTLGRRATMRLLFGLSLLLAAASAALAVAGNFGLIFDIGAGLLGVALLVSSARLLAGEGTGAPWKVYKLSAYPYLGLILAVACVDRWLPLLH